MAAAASCLPCQVRRVASRPLLDLSASGCLLQARRVSR